MYSSLTMDPKYHGSPLLAPSASSYALRMPGDHERADGSRRFPSIFPSIEDHLVTPELTRDEVVRGQKLLAFPAHREHATRQCGVGFLISGNVVPEYESSVEMLTRVGPGSDFAADVAVLRKGTDPATGTRYLEELAFEVVSKQSMRDITMRAEDLSNRGVRRVIAIFIERGEVREWDRATNDWRILPLDGDFTDPVLVHPFKVRALLDPQVSEDAVAEGLDAKGNPALVRIKTSERAEGKAEGRAEGRAEGKAEGRAEGKAEGAVDALTRSTLRLLRKRGLEPTGEQRARLLTCRDPARLERWLDATLDVHSVAELLAIE